MSTGGTARRTHPWGASGRVAGRGRAAGLAAPATRAKPRGGRGRWVRWTGGTHGENTDRVDGELVKVGVAHDGGFWQTGQAIGRVWSRKREAGGGESRQLEGERGEVQAGRAL